MPLFVPDFDELPLDDLIESLGAGLAARYTEAETVVLAEAARRSYRILALEQQGAEAADALARQRYLRDADVARAQALRDLRELATREVGRIRELRLAEDLVYAAATSGEAAAAAMLGVARRLPTTHLTGSAAQAVGALTFDLHSKLDWLNWRITRFPDDVYKQVMSNTIPSTILGAETSVLSQRRAVQRFLADGITGFTDKAGRNWRIGSYAEMAGRTAAQRAWGDAGIWRMRQAGVNLVTIEGGLDACARCAPWIGRILSTDGSTGYVTVPHGIEPRQVTVLVHGTIDQARAAGWGHPNCRDRPIAYIPGVSAIPEGVEHDPEAETERARQRELERNIRSAKRDMELAGDEVTRAAAARDVRAAQGEMREFIRDTGRNRRSYREQLHFADGRGPLPRARGRRPSTPGRPGVTADGVSARTLPKVQPSARAPQIVPEGAFPRPHELATGDRLANVGIRAHWRIEDFTPGVKNPDVMIDGHAWDFKSPEGSSKHTISKQFSRAKAQGVQRLVIDLSRSQLDAPAALEEARRRLAGGDWFTDVIVIEAAGTVTWLTKQ